MKRTNNKNTQNDFWKGTIPDNRNNVTSYGRCVNISYGLIIGLVIDKCLFYVTKGLSIIFPPFAALLMGKGKVLFTLRFEKTFNGVFEKLLSHIIAK